MSDRLVVPIRSGQNPQFTLTFGERALNDRAKRNALRIEMKRMELAFANLPAEFDGFRILQPSDLHVDFLPEPLDAALDLIAGEEVDLCVRTGA